MPDKSNLPLPLEVLNQGMIDMMVGTQFGTRGWSAGVAAFLKIAVIEINPETGVCHCAFKVEDEHLMFTGQVHGACIASLIDTAMPLLVYPFVPIGSWVATTNLNINYLKSVDSGIVDAFSTLETLGSSSAVVTTRVENNGREVALATGQCMLKRIDGTKLRGDTWGH